MYIRTTSVYLCVYINMYIIRICIHLCTYNVYMCVRIYIQESKGLQHNVGTQWFTNIFIYIFKFICMYITRVRICACIYKYICVFVYYGCIYSRKQDLQYNAGISHCLHIYFCI